MQVFCEHALERLRSGTDEERLQAASALSRMQIRTRGSVRTRGSLGRSAESAFSPELGQAAMESVLAALQHESQAIRKEVIVALGEWGDERAAGILSTIAGGDHQDADEEVRRAALAALGTLGGPTAVHALCQAAEGDSSEANRYDALVALNGLVQEQPTPALTTRGAIRTRGGSARPYAGLGGEARQVVTTLEHIRDKQSEKTHLRRMAEAVLGPLAE